MQKEIIVQDQAIAYTFRKSRRARRMRLSVHPDGSVVLTSPSRLGTGLGERFAERFIREKSAWLISKLDFFKKRRSADPANPAAPRLGKKDYLQNKERALAVAKEKVARFAAFYGVGYKKISIKNQKTCWGSCSRKGNLNFNYKLLFLPDDIQNYIIVHEVCHLRAFNHSKQFWSLVAQTIPNHVAIRKGLRKNGLNFY